MSEWEQIWNDYRFSISKIDLLDMIVNGVQNQGRSFKCRQNSINKQNLTYIERQLADITELRQQDPNNPDHITLEDEYQVQYELLLDDIRQKKTFRNSVLDKVIGDRVCPKLCALDKDIASKKYISKVNTSYISNIIFFDKMLVAPSSDCP